MLTTEQLAGFRLQLLKEKEEIEEALRLADRRKNEFLAMLAHELRNPLTPLHHAAEILRQSLRD